MKDKHHKQSEADFNGTNLGRFFLGVLIIIIGLTYLAQKFGAIFTNTGYFMSHFWSLLLIWLGLSLLSKRNKIIQLAGLTFAVVILCFVVAAVLGLSGSSESGRVQVVNIIKSEYAESAKINIDSGAMVLRLAGGGETLVSGKFESEFFKLSANQERIDGIDEVNLQTTGKSNLERWRSVAKNLNSFDLKISTSTPVELNIKSVAADMALDLSEILIDRTVINSGASNIGLILGNRLVKSNVDITAGASSITIEIPKTVGVEIKIASSLSSSVLPDLVKTTDNTYLSTNFGKAKNKVKINLDAGVSRVEIKWK